MTRMPNDTNKHPSVLNLPLAEPLVSKPTKASIDILVGNDHYFDFVGLDHMKYEDGLVMLNTKLGFIPTGKGVQQESTILADVMCMSVDHKVVNPDFDLKKFWQLEHIGITDETKEDNEMALDLYNENVQFVNGRYVVSWPWKIDPSENLPENFELANGRLKSLVKRLRQTPEVLQKYHETIVGQLEKGVIEEVSTQLGQDSPCHYIPFRITV